MGHPRRSWNVGFPRLKGETWGTRAGLGVWRLPRAWVRLEEWVGDCVFNEVSVSNLSRFVRGALL